MSGFFGRFRKMKGSADHEPSEPIPDEVKWLYEDDDDDEWDEEEDEDEFSFIPTSFESDSDGEGFDVYEAALIWASNGKDDDYMFGYSEDELEAAL